MSSQTRYLARSSCNRNSRFLVSMLGKPMRQSTKLARPSDQPSTDSRTLKLWPRRQSLAVTTEMGSVKKQTMVTTTSLTTITIAVSILGQKQKIAEWHSETFMHQGSHLFFLQCPHRQLQLNCYLRFISWTPHRYHIVDFFVANNGIYTSELCINDETLREVTWTQVA